MPDTVNPAPAQKQKPLSLSFFYASNGQAQQGEAILKKLGEAVLNQLGEEPSYASVFPAATAEIIRAYHDGSLKKKDDADDDFIDQVVKPVMEDFLNVTCVTCPSVKNQPQKAQWIFEQYLSHRQEGRPIKAEDLHKIGKNIAYFDGLRKSPLFKNSVPKPNSDLAAYETYAAFEEMLVPYLERKAKTKVAADSFHLNPQEKAQVMAKTVMLYDGPEGKVVVALSPESCSFWGSDTRWCINSPQWRNYRINFPHANKTSPIIMLLPKGRHRDKVMLLDKEFWDNANEKMPTLPQRHCDLLQSCLAGLSEGARRGMEPWIPEGATAPGDHKIRDAYAVRKLRNGFYFVASMKGSIRHPMQKKVPDNTRLTARKVRTLKRIAEKGDSEKLVQRSRRYPATWVDADTFFAADPAETIRKIEAEMPAKRPLLSRLRP